jgi:dTDP-4-amino-4,6-dideoxygalactose transaminase
MKLFTDKAYDRTTSVRNPEVFGMNYRITELQAAVGRVQLSKLAGIVARRREFACKMLNALKDVPGLLLPSPPDINQHSWWYMILRADRNTLSTPAKNLAEAMEAEGVPAWTGYNGGQPVYLYDCFQRAEKGFYPITPLTGGRDMREVYYRGLCPEAEKQLGELIILSMSEHYTNSQVDGIIGAVAKVFGYYAANQ